MNEQKLVPLFIPTLIAILVNAEDKKGEPLNKDEVIAIRDSSLVMMVEESHAEKMAESRGYQDVDPKNCWYDWQMVRRELGRQPELDPGAKMNFHSIGDAMNNAMEIAKSSIEEFRKLLVTFGNDDVFPLVKVKLEEELFSAFIWLLVKDVAADCFVCEIFELPSEFNGYKVGDLIQVSNSNLSDWMINNDGIVHGGFTIRVQREDMSPIERKKFDEQMGVVSYA